MADKERDVWQTPRNAGIGVLADALSAGKRGLNYVQLADLLGSPMLAGTAVRRNLASGNEGLGVGDLLLGQAPEEVDRWSYGDSPFYEQHYGFNPTIRPDRRGNIVDTAMLPVAETAALAKLAGRGATKVAEKAGIKSLLKEAAEAEKPVDKGRRAALKGLAAVPAAAVAAHVAPKLLEKTAAKDVEKAAGKAATKAVTHATPEEFGKVMERIYDDALHNGNVVDHPKALHEAKVPWKQDKWGGRDYNIHSSEYSKLYGDEADKFIEKHGADEYNKLIYEVEAFPNLEDYFTRGRHLDELATLRKDPQFAPYVDYMYPGGNYDLGSDLITPDHPIHEKIKRKASGGSIENTTHDRKLI
jgi:hypothetical protein